jgi:hypothetical protein
LILELFFVIFGIVMINKTEIMSMTIIISINVKPFSFFISIFLRFRFHPLDGTLVIGLLSTLTQRENQ